MAGLNKSLKAGTVVFKAGDNADGMYLVRKGELVVYLEQAGKEVVLAKIVEGGMVGEMALFDRMPRSASVKATVDTEITHISIDDFGKLMKQIPKWFVSLMSALSGRLRTTNERLKSMEASGSTAASTATSSASSASARAFQNTLRMLHVMELLWHREAAKEGKEWMISKKIIDEELTGMFGESPAKVATLIEILCSESIIFAKIDNYKNPVLSMPNRASLRQFALFLSTFTKANPKITKIPDPIMGIMTVLSRNSAKAPYDQFTMTLEEIVEEGLTAGLDANRWRDFMSSFQNFGDAVKLTKTSSKSGMGLRITKGELTSLMKNLHVFNKLSEKKMD